jgi:atlastin
MTEAVPNKVQQTPLEIVSGNFELNMENLTKVLKRREIAGSPVAIISVSGVTRTGKSFLLTILMLYLKYYKQSNKFGSVVEPIHSIFPWKSGNKPHTAGIWMWPQPFYVEGIEIPILLMDTQGVFGSNSDNATSAKIFALRYQLIVRNYNIILIFNKLANYMKLYGRFYSMLNSSIQIYNIFRNLQENNLEILDTFTEYGRLASQHCLQGKRPFQHLIFLLRDWQFTQEHEYGAAGGEELIKEYLDTNDNQKQTAQKVRNHISKCFEKISGFLLPSPGSNVTEGTFNKVADIDEAFRKHLEKFAEGLFDPANIKAKEINGIAANGSDIFDYFVNCFNTFAQENIPSPVSMIEATTKTTNLLAISKAMENYKLCMTEDSDSLEGKRLLIKHDQTMRRALKEFINLPKYGEIETSFEYMEQLLNQMWDFYDGIDKKSKEALEKAAKGFESRAKMAFMHYSSHMDEKFGPDAVDAQYFVNFNKFQEEDDKYYKEAIKIFSEYEETSLKELGLKYKAQLKEKIATHYKELNRNMKKRYEEIQKTHEEKLIFVKSFYKEEMDKILDIDDITKLNDEKELEESHKTCTEKAIAKFMNDIIISVPQITEEYKKRIKEYTDSDLERIKRNIQDTFVKADKTCQNVIEGVTDWYVEKMRQFESLNDARDKHPEIFQEAKNMFSKRVEEMNETFKNFSQKYLPILDDEIITIHDRHLTRGYLNETFNNLYQNQIKIIVVGDKNVGKTSLVSRFTKNHFVKIKSTRERIFETTPDIGARITTVRNKRRYRIFRYWDALSVKIAIWDTCNVNDSRNLPDIYYQNAEGVIIVLDVTNSDTILSLDSWIENINKVNPGARKYLIANKTDEVRRVQTQDIEKNANRHSIPFKEVSAQNSANVDDAFHDFASSLMTNKKFCVIL